MTRFVMIAALLVAACNKTKTDSGPSCDKVVDHMQVLMKQMMPGHDEAALGDRKQMIAQCEQRKMPASVRRCLVEAKSFNDLAACQKPGSTPATQGAPAPRPAAPSASPSPSLSEAPPGPPAGRTPATGSASSD
jgi:hypothetical protein